MTPPSSSAHRPSHPLGSANVSSWAALDPAPPREPHCHLLESVTFPPRKHSESFLRGCLSPAENSELITLPSPVQRPCGTPVAAWRSRDYRATSAAPFSTTRPFHSHLAHQISPTFPNAVCATPCPIPPHPIPRSALLSSVTFQILFILQTPSNIMTPGRLLCPTQAFISPSPGSFAQHVRGCDLCTDVFPASCKLSEGGLSSSIPCLVHRESRSSVNICWNHGFCISFVALL